MFKNKRYVTCGIQEQVDVLMQMFMWRCIDLMPAPKDYLQVFKFEKEGKKLKITHEQEDPAYKQEYICDAPVFWGKIFVIDDGRQSTMLLASEY